MDSITVKTINQYQSENVYYTARMSIHEQITGIWWQRLRLSLCSVLTIGNVKQFSFLDPEWIPNRYNVPVVHPLLILNVSDP